MISKELLTQALQMYPQYSKNDECTGVIASILSRTNIIHFEVNSNSMQYTNIYELAHKCKEWAWKTHNKIVSSEVSVDDWVSIVAHFYGNLEVNIEESFSGITEPEAIFKACQWVLDNKETK